MHDYGYMHSTINDIICLSFFFLSNAFFHLFLYFNFKNLPSQDNAYYKSGLRSKHAGNSLQITIETVS